MQSNKYVLGTPHGGTKPYATFETKPPSILKETRRRDGSIHLRRDSGAGYERWRSYEVTNERTGRKSDVYVYVHRLLAVSECFPEEMPMAQVLDELNGRDVHHTTGVQWANFGESPNFAEPGIQLVEHGRHGEEITFQKRRAWAEDRRREVERQESGHDLLDRCVRCGAEGVDLWVCADFDGEYCLECAVDANRGSTLREA